MNTLKQAAVTAAIGTITLGSVVARPLLFKKKHHHSRKIDIDFINRYREGKINIKHKIKKYKGCYRIDDDLMEALTTGSIELTDQEQDVLNILLSKKSLSKAISKYVIKEIANNAQPVENQAVNQVTPTQYSQGGQNNQPVENQAVNQVNTTPAQYSQGQLYNGIYIPNGSYQQP